MKPIVRIESIERRIYLIRGQRVMLDRDLAELYGVSTGDLNQAVKRQKKRFPADFMFQMSREELADWISQFVISNPSIKKGLRKPPRVFAEQGVAMLASVLSSDRAIRVNIAIVRAFVRLRALLTANPELAGKLAELERRVANHDEDIRSLFTAIHGLMNEPDISRKRIGFIVKDRPSLWSELACNNGTI